MSSVQTDRPVRDWLRWWAWWVAGTTIGWAVGSAAGWPLGWVESVVVGWTGRFPPFAIAPVAWLWSGGLGAAGFGAVAGIGQWAVLRHMVEPSGRWRWVLASAAGWSLVAALRWVVVPLEAMALGLLGAGAAFLVGLPVEAAPGVAQWLVLRRWVRGAGWWILGTLLGGLVWRIDLLWLASALAGPLPWPVAAASVGGVLGAIDGGVTGLVLVFLLGRSDAGTRTIL